MTADHPQQAGRVTILTRVFDAPRELVFRAWLEPEHLLKWFSAGNGWTTPYAETDPRPGGKIRIGFADPTGVNSFDLEGVYDEIVEPERIVFTMADRRPVTVTLEPEGEKTKLTLELTLETTFSEEHQRHGWGAMLTHLGELLAELQQPA